MILYLWHVNPGLVVRGFVDVQNDDPEIMGKLVDLSQELKILSSLLELIPFRVGIRLAALASRKEFLDLENWLTSNLVTFKDSFFEECLKFLKESQLGASQDFSRKPFHHGNAAGNFDFNTISTILKALKAHSPLILNIKLPEEVEKLEATIVDSNPRLQNGGSAESSAPDGYSEDVEAEANSYFHQMFSGELTIDAMVQMLARFKESSLAREQSIFECMIGNLFEEYRFFPKYPERQLRIAAVLFGSVIKHQLVTHLTLGIALRGVLDALRKPPDSKMFVFGTNALEQFVDRLIEWPQYCNHILQISHLRGAHSELVAFIERALARISSGNLESESSNTSATHQHVLPQATPGELNAVNATAASPQSSSSTNIHQRLEGRLDDRHKLPVASSNDSKPLLSTGGQPSVGSLADLSAAQRSVSSTQAMPASSPGFLRPSRSVTSTRFGSALNIETLVAAAERRETPIEAPASEIQDKISFIINNISTANIEVKGREFSEVLTEQYYPWFAQYMVMKRASIEPNFHDLYLKFLDKINLKALNRDIVQATYENCKVLLGSELIKSSSEERSLLKNLGSWLGKLTIGRNQVLRAREIDPKSLIIEAYEKGLMIAVIPFTSKVLEPCQSSLAYQPPNPWTMGILGLLAEIYSMPNLKMNLKFDIEVLFKNLSVDMKDITPTSLLKDRKREIEGNPDFSNKDVGPSQSQIVPEVKSGMMSPLNPGELPLEVASPPSSTMLPQFPAPVLLSSGTMMEDEKLAVLSLSDQLPSGQALFQATPAQSLYAVNQLSAVSMANIAPHVIINQKLQGWSLHLHFQRVVPHAIERAVKDIVASIVQRSVSIATQTTKELVLKDYAMETDETRIYHAAHLMVASLAGSLAHVTCKEPLRTSISNQLRSSLHGLSITNELLEHAVLLATNDNLDLGCALIEQAATEKAIQTINGEIAHQLQLRRKHRDSVGQTLFETNMYTQASLGVLPEALRPKPGHLSLSQQRVYEDFVRLPWQNQSSQGSQSIAAGSSTSAAFAASGLTSSYGSLSGQLSTGYSSSVGGLGFDAASQTLDLGSEALDSSPALLPSSSSINIGADAVMRQNSEKNAISSSFSVAGPATELPLIDSSDSMKEPGASSQPISSSTASERVGNSVTEPSLSTRDALDKYQVVAQKLEALVTGDGKEAELQGVIAEVPEIILRCISRDEAALAVAQKVFKGLYENTSNTFHVSACLAILVAIRDVCKLVVKELTSWVYKLSFFQYIFQVIYSDEERKFNKDITMGLIHSELLNLAEYNVHMAKLIDGGRNSMRLRRNSLFHLSRLWLSMSTMPFSELHNLVEALAKIAAKPGSSESLQQLIEIVRNPTANAAAISAFAVGKDDKTRQRKVGVNLVGSCSLSQWDYLKLYLPVSSRLPVKPSIGRDDFNNVESVEPDPAGFRDQELSVDHCLSSEVVNSGGMQGPQQGQNMSFLAIDIFAKLVFAILKMLTSFAQRSIFCNLLKFLLSGKHHYAWLELVSHRSFMPKLLTGNAQKGWPYVQRLLVDLFQFLEPFLRNAELRGPIDLLPEIREPPHILSEVDAALRAKNMKADVDEYLKTRQQGSLFLANLKQRLLLVPSEASTAGSHYNVALVNSLVLYTGMQTLVVELDNEGRYLFLNAVANQLRYPNNHTHYFSFVLLYLFAESNQEIIQEQITRVLLERLIVNRPHPWGLLITFIELIKNPRYNFWNRTFIRCAPEIEKLFESVARSCGGLKPMDESMVSGTNWASEGAH
ncbi:unnamed protein product [Linum tenue]|uniref:CCR4-NOT transcription complex subunit 1 n=1 Tax=Linum tenue TaxID=586396 RepID=A0AAV0I9W2_9ROSI|nr:unnamed protein product [Linum tenue]